MLYLGLSYIQNDAPKLLLMAQPLKHPQSESALRGSDKYDWNSIRRPFDGRLTLVKGRQSHKRTVNPVLFACPLFREFYDLGNLALAKITGH